MNLPAQNVNGRSPVPAPSDGTALNPAAAAPAPARRRAPAWQRAAAVVVQLFLVAAIGTAAWKAQQWIIDSAPKAERKSRERVARLVEVEPVALARQGPIVQAWGEVQAAQTLVVRPEISGTVTWVHPEVTPGGRLRADEVVARFDDRDLRLSVRQAQADIAEIEARILIERGQGEIGKRELSRLTRNLTDAQKALVLRMPQMAQLQAELDSARAVLEQAELALSRAEVKAPFDALVTAEQVAPGAVITQGSETATLVASDRFHVVLAVPATALGWLRLDGTQTVTLTQPGTWPADISRTGTILRLGSGLTETGRMIEVIVEVRDPISTDAPPLLLGSFVHGRIEGEPISGAVTLDRAMLRDNETVWVNVDGRLEIRPVTIAWRGTDHVIVTDGLEPGDQVVVTTLTSYTPGMALRTRGGGT